MRQHSLICQSKSQVQGSSTQSQHLVSFSLLRRKPIVLPWRMQSGTSVSTRNQGRLPSFNSPLPLILWCHHQRLRLHTLLLVPLDVLAGIETPATVALHLPVGIAGPLTTPCRIVLIPKTKRRFEKMCSSIPFTNSKDLWKANRWFATLMGRHVLGT